MIRKMGTWMILTLFLLAGCSGTGGNGTTPPAASGSPDSSNSAPAKLQKVRFSEVIHSIFYAPQYVAAAKGFFVEEGIELDSSTAQGSDKGTAALLAGTADVALVGPETTVFVYNQDSPVKVKMFAQMTAKDGSFLMAREPNPAFKWEATKGKTIIGFRVGSMPQMVASTLLTQTVGQDVEYLTNIAIPAAPGAFQSGQGDYIQVYEPVASQLEQAKSAYIVSSFGESYGDVPFTGYVATDKFIEENPELVQKFTNAVYKAMLYMEKTDPAVVAKEIAPAFEGTDLSLIESAIKRYAQLKMWKETPVMAAPDFSKLQSLMIAGGVLEVGKEAPFDKITVNTFAEKAVTEIK